MNLQDSTGRYGTIPTFYVENSKQFTVTVTGTYPTYFYIGRYLRYDLNSILLNVGTYGIGT